MGRKRKVLKTVATVELAEANAQIEQRSIQIEMVGSPGTNINSGYLAEEYLRQLQGTRAAEIYDKMRRSDGKVAMVLQAVANPILGASWEVEPGGDSEEEKQQAELVKHILFSDLENPWIDYVEEYLTIVPFGFMVFERTHKVVQNHPEFGSYVGFRDFAFRSQKTIERWNLDPLTQRLKSVHQAAYGDLQKPVDIPAQFLTIFTIKREGVNFEGISPLRPAYGPWLRKHNYLKLEAIGIEKNAVPIPNMEVPEGKENSKQYQNAKKVLQDYTSHQSNYTMTPAGWKLSYHNSGFNPQTTRQSIKEEDLEIVSAFLANFLLLGSSGGGGSFALSNDLSDFFLTSLEFLANKYVGAFNRTLIPELINLNFGPQKRYPTLKATGISDKAGAEFGALLSQLAQSRYITPDDPLEDNLRQRLKLPKRSNEGQRLPQPAQSFGAQQPGVQAAAAAQKFSENAALKLAERRGSEVVRLIKDSAEELVVALREQLRAMAGELVAKLIKRAGALPEATRITAIRDLTVGGKGALEDLLKNRLAHIALETQDAAITELPLKLRKTLKLSEDDFIPPSKKELEALPKSVRRAIETQAALISEAQAADLQKAVYFQFAGSIDSTDSLAVLEKDLAAAARKFVESPAASVASTNVASLVVNKTRGEFFKRDDVFAEVESFTFVNSDPQSEICKDLAGRTWDKNDPEADRYIPPLHHNCASTYVANFKGEKNPEIDESGLTPSSPSLQKYITL